MFLECVESKGIRADCKFSGISCSGWKNAIVLSVQTIAIISAIIICERFLKLNVILYSLNSYTATINTETASSIKYLISENSKGKAPTARILFIVTGFEISLNDIFSEIILP